MELFVKTRDGSYPVIQKRGVLKEASRFWNLDRKCMIVIDSHLSPSVCHTLIDQCREPYLYMPLPGEQGKSLASFEKILGEMVKAGFTRGDCVIALGGGVVGDLAGFAASAFARGVDFYNVPTTVLSQVDSSVGGKVAVNFRGLKNAVGAFYPPKGVLLDGELLDTLPHRQMANGLAEAVKIALCLDEALFSLLEKDPFGCLDQVIFRSVSLKKTVVEEDERESGLRKVLNFGHTLAHGLESRMQGEKDPLYHGECVALGMIPMCSPEVRQRLIPLLERLRLPVKFPVAPWDLLETMSHDKKRNGDRITLIRVERVGSYRMATVPFAQFEQELKGMRV